MKQAFRILLCFLIIIIFGLPAEAGSQQAKISPKGETIIKYASKKLDVKVVVTTHEVQIGKPTDERPDKISSSCTYTRHPCSVVDSIDIAVNDKPIFVPRSAFCDLADLNTVEIGIKQKNVIMKIIGGDASESYTVIIEFDAVRIKHRTFMGNELPDSNNKLQETIYYRQVLKDE